MSLRPSSPLRSAVLIVLVAAAVAVLLSWGLISEAMRTAAGARTGEPPQAEAEQSGRATVLDRELAGEGERLFAAQCAACHGAQADWPIAARLKGRSRDEFYALLDHLRVLNPVMPGFEGSDRERRALAEYLASLREGGGQTVP
jgi:mono/diheme cytochrome c family protein